jgi:arylsulfatase A-like enzyme
MLEIRIRPRLFWIVAIVLSLSIADYPAFAASAKPGPPNIVLILADDLGYADLGFTGARDIATPNLDALAREGVRCTQAYVTASMCSPSRAGLMTGRYQARWGHDSNYSTLLLPPTELNLAQRLKALGYVTGIVGKWHLGQPNKLDEMPLARGFDEAFLTAHNAQYFDESYFDSLGSAKFERLADQTLYSTDLCGARGADFIRRHRDRPFFLYLPFNAVHENMFVPLRLEAPQKYLDRVGGITAPARRTMAAMVLGLDDAVGVVMRALRETGLDENTLVFFLSDNGGVLQFVQQGTSNNAPFSGGKGTLREGGIRTPFVVRWKAHFPAGGEYSQPVSSLDIVPTAVAACRSSHPAPRDEANPADLSRSDSSALDGVNLLPFLEGRTADDPHTALYWRVGERGVIRKGDWKLLHSSSSGARELYRLADDLGERNNLARQYPEKVAELAADWRRWNATMSAPQSIEPTKGKGK